MDRAIPSEEEVAGKLTNSVNPLLNTGQVKARLHKVKAGKAAGPDSIPSWVLKTFPKGLVPVLCDIFNSCILHNIFPYLWKEALVKVVPKTTKPCFPADY